MAKAITVIPATKNQYTALPKNALVKRRVAAYARVSTDSDEQFTSYEAQIDYYTKLIQKRDDWEFVGVYADEGITGTSTKNRDGFNEMINDALAGKIDLIITKSVSRFARNTVDSLTTVRKLKEHRVEVFFEKENIYTFDSKGELLITIMSSLAQEESRSISENVTWGQRKRFADRKVSMPYSHFLGYDKGPDGQPIINEEEAKTVRLIYSLFLHGKTPSGICRHLDAAGIATPTGRKRWSDSTVLSILQNEKYKGDALLQKKYTVDFLTKKQKVNEGEIPQYYVENSHPAIVSAEDFEHVQMEISRRRQLGRSYSGSSIFFSKLICGDCGAFYGKKVWHSNDSYRRTVWHCNNKFTAEEKCSTPTLDTVVIQQLFLQAYNELMGNRKPVIMACEEVRNMLCDFTQLDEQIEALNEEIHLLVEMVGQCIKENASTEQSQEEYTKKYNALSRKYDTAIAKLKKKVAERDQQAIQEKGISAFIASLKKCPLIVDAWDEELWITLVDTATVHHDNKIIFRFKDGTEITRTIYSPEDSQ